MANLDTRAKRASAIGIDSPMLHLWPLADGTIAQGDRQQTAFKYSGILAGAAAAIVWFNGLTTSMRLTGAGAA